MKPRVIIFWTVIVAIAVHILYVGLPITTNTPENISLVDILYAFLSITITMFTLIITLWYIINNSLILMDRIGTLVEKWYKKYISQTK